MQDPAEIEQALDLMRTFAKRIDTVMRLDLQEVDPPMDSLLRETLEYGLFAGGKRIRPLLCSFAARLSTGKGEEDPRLDRLAIAFEYLHAATLFHDDIIDRSENRRGRPSVYKKFGPVAAILAGDFLHAHAMAMVGLHAGQPGLTSFCRATMGMVDGEFMQLRNARVHSLSEIDYYHTVQGKTGLLIASACEVGAIYGGGSIEQVEAVRSYGENLGYAFQIVDDLLDYLGDSGITGKNVGNDLAEGKMTLPLILTLEEASQADQARLLEILADPELRASSFFEVRSMIEKYDGFSKAMEKAYKASAEAVASLAIFPDKIPERSLLESLARYVVTRKK